MYPPFPNRHHHHPPRNRPRIWVRGLNYLLLGDETPDPRHEMSDEDFYGRGQDNPGDEDPPVEDNPVDEASNSENDVELGNFFLCQSLL